MDKKKLITRNEYMQDSSNLHHEYFLQFATDKTKAFILSSLNIADIKKALAKGDCYLNKIKIPYNNMSFGGGWWWDGAPINEELARKAGESISMSVRTSVAKAMAKELTK